MKGVGVHQIMALYLLQNVALVTSVMLYDNHYAKCEAMKDALEDFVDEYLLDGLTSDEKIYQKHFVYLTTGIDINNEKEVRKLACRIQDVRSVKELSGVLNLPYSTTRRYFKTYTSLIKFYGGLPGLERAFSLSKFLVTAANMTGFPNWPPNGTINDAALFFKDIVDGNGRDVTVMTRLDRLFSIKVTINDPMAWGETMMETVSPMEFADRLHLDRLKVVLIGWQIKQYLQEPHKYRQFMHSTQAFIDLAKAFDTYELLSLPNKIKKGKNGKGKIKNNQILKPKAPPSQKDPFFLVLSKAMGASPAQVPGFGG